ncbi:hypothetical protein C2G38_2241612 [Gigaspora rosea]|uniref:Peptidase S1 domain-containing protein n=1 Tax=Gigaspora rosea TaxID=44941 RepID=A0A397W1C0_9GLOM|nr:hypothetical protein C2G38_2241612 [Gigaspora rosea]
MKGIYISINLVFILSNFLMKNLSTIDEILRLYLDDDDFGGTYIDVIHRMIFINTLNETRAEQIKNLPEIRLYANSLNFSKALNSTAILNSGINDMLILARRYRPVECLGYIDVKVNNIVIATCDDDRNKNEAFLNATKIYYPIYMYYNCFPEINNNIISQNNIKFENRNDIASYILAGDGLSIERFNRTTYKCSAGFWAKSRFNPINYIVTAGHCYRRGASYYLLPWNSTDENVKYYVGKMLIHYLSPIDVGLIPILGNVTPVANIRNTDSKEFPQLWIKDHIVVSSNGAHLCISGLYSHVKCGNVKALSGFASTLDREDYIEKLFVVSMSTVGGDSGGPVFSYNQDLISTSINGILLGGFDYDINGDINNAIIQVTPIDFILNYNGIEIITVT